MREPGRLRTLAVAAGLTIVAVGCGGATHASAPGRTATSAAPTSTASPPTVPNPFTIIARDSAKSLGLQTDPGEFAIGHDGNLYVTDGSDRVTVISSDGTVVRRWGRPGSGPGEFSFGPPGTSGPLSDAASIAVGADGRVYVSDSGNHRVEVFSPTGTFIRQFGSFGAGRGQFLGGPSDLAVGPDGSAYVVDGQELSVSKFSPTGRFEWAIGGSTAGNPQLSQQFHLSLVDAHGRVVMANESGWILYIDAKGHRVDAFELPAGFGPCNVTVDDAGDTFVQSCPVGQAGSPPTFRFQGPLVFDRTHRLIGAWYGGPVAVAPRFGPNGEIFTLGDDGSVLKLKVALPGA